jgi:hypothetical protein
MGSELFLAEDFDNKTSEEIIDYLLLALYKPEMIERRDRDIFNQLPLPLQTTILVIDFDTEVAMNGISGFLENLTGLFFPETIEAFERIGAIQTTRILSNIATIMSKYDISIQDLRSNVNRQSVWSITSFSQTHCEQALKMAEEIEKEASSLYLYETETDAGEPIWTMLASYIDERKGFLVNQLQS